MDSNNDSVRAATAGCLRVRAARAEQIILDLTPLELSIVATLERIRLASGRELARLHFAPSPSGARHARRVLASLTARRVLARLDRRIGGKRAGSAGYLYGLDVVGQRLVRPDSTYRRPWTPGHPVVAHAVAVTDCYVRLVELTRAGRLELLDFDAEPACWRSFAAGGGTRLTLKPDAYVRLANGAYEDRWFLEVDRATEDLGRILRKAQLYGRYWQSGREAVFPRVLWLTIRLARRKALQRALRQLPADHQRLFQVDLLSEFDAVITAGAADQLLNDTTRGGDT
ncbi:MAG: replication-relaxation family protein [Frankiaceae bacterium]